MRAVQLIKSSQPGATRLRIGYVVKRFPRFSETFILNELLALEQLGFDVTVFSLLRVTDEQRHGAFARLRSPVIYLPRNASLTKTPLYTHDNATSDVVKSVQELIDHGTQPFGELLIGKDASETGKLCEQAMVLSMLATSRGIEHFHAHFATDATTVTLLASRLSKIPYSFTAHARDIYHTYVDPEIDDDVRRQKIDEARFVVTVSEANRRHLVKLAPRAGRNHILRLYNGVDLSRFKPDAVGPSSRLFVGVGRLVEKKGFKYLVEACEELRRQHPDFRCMIIGDGPLREDLDRKIRGANLEHQVLLAGPLPQEQLRETLSRAVALVLPSIVTPTGDRDALPTVLLEAMAMGLPTISTRVGGIPEIIDDGETGWLVSPGNAAELASAMSAVLRDPGTARNKGLAGRCKAAREFDLDKNVSRLAELFRTSVRGANAQPQSGYDAARLRYG